MKVTVFSAKGGVGKTPISVNIALDRGWAIGTNETYHVLESMRRIEDSRMMAIAPTEEFPDIPDMIDMVFDLSGSLGGDSARSIRSAIRQSNVVVVPTNNEFKAINGAYHTINEVRDLNPNIIIAATKLEKGKRDAPLEWDQCEDFMNIKKTLLELVGHEYPVVPLKKSKGYDAIFDQEKSLREIVDRGGIEAFSYRIAAWQFDKLYEEINKFDAS